MYGKVPVGLNRPGAAGKGAKGRNLESTTSIQLPIQDGDDAGTRGPS